MRYHCPWLVTLAACLFLHISALAQHTSDSSTIQLPVHYVDDVAEKAGRIEEKIDGIEIVSSLIPIGRVLKGVGWLYRFAKGSQAAKALVSGAGAKGAHLVYDY